MEWLTTSWSTLGIVAVKALLTYAALVVFVRVAGLRAFSKMSSFDFAVTVAFGSVLASAVLAPQPPLPQVVFALAILMALQAIVAWARKWDVVARCVDNEPLLLMAGSEVLEDNLRSAQVTRKDLAEKLREASVVDMRQVRAVVMETTGDISVLKADPGDPPLDPQILAGVRDAERLFAGAGHPRSADRRPTASASVASSLQNANRTRARPSTGSG